MGLDARGQFNRGWAAVLVIVALVVVASAVGTGLLDLSSNTGADDRIDRPSSGVPEPQSGTYQTVVAFRNDDIQPAWRVDVRTAVDEIFIEERVPVTLGIIPIVNGQPISDNEPLCSYLQALDRNHPGTFEVALHGYTHEQRTDFLGASEFGGSSRADQQRWLADGTAILQACSGVTPTTFVPPFDAYDEVTVEVLVDGGYRVVSGSDDQTEPVFGEREPFLSNGIVHVPNDGDIVADWSTHAFYTPEQMQARFDQAYEDGESYVQMIHYFTFTSEEKREQLQSFVQYIKGHDDVLFLSLGEFGQATTDGRLTQTDSGWVYSAP